MTRVILAAVFVASCISAPFAQSTPQAEGPRFEVASVRLCSLAAISFDELMAKTPNDGIRYYKPCITVRALVLFAYDVPLSRLRGELDWMAADYFRVDARVLEPVGVSDMRMLVRQLLSERFAFKSHTETVEQRIYRLVLTHPDKGLGSSAKPSSADCTNTPTASDKLVAASPRCNSSGVGRRGDTLVRTWNGVTMAQFAEFLAGSAKAVVVDRTGLGGVFDLGISYLAEDGAGSGAFDWQGVVEEQLGLKLEPARGPVDVLVIDSVQQPTEN